MKTSIGYMMDSTPPAMGLVLDGVDAEDSDYVTDRTSYAAHWDGFVDPHSDIMGYEWAIGSCYGCTDVQNFISVGLMTGRCYIVHGTFVICCDRVNHGRPLTEGRSNLLCHGKGLQHGWLVYHCVL